MPRLSATTRHRLRLTLNGRATVAEVEPRMLLTDFLRHTAGLTGTHVGCEHGVCGACTIQIDGRPARACLTLAIQIEGCDIRTIEVQCGFCTPGMLMSLDAFLRDHPDPSESAVREYLSGHLCRCTGYVPIIAAALDAARRLREAGDA